jgi:hypothetical protein
VLCFSVDWAHASYLNEGASQLRDTALNRINAFHSLECTYVYYSDIAKNNKKVPSKVIFKTKGKLISHDRTYILDGINDVVQQRCAETNVNGKIDWLLIEERISVNNNMDKFHFLGYATLSPLTITGQNSFVSFYNFEENTLRDFLGEGNDFYFLEREGRKTLNIFLVPENGDYEKTVTYGLILYFDKNDYIEQIDTVRWPACTPQDLQNYPTSIPFYDLYDLVATDIFQNWQVIDGVNVPLTVTRTDWKYDFNSGVWVEAISPSFEQFESKLISICEHSINIEMVMVEKLSPPGIQEEYRMEIDPATVKINNPNLTDAEFQLQYDKADVTWDRETGDYTDDLLGSGNSLEDKKKETEEYIKKYDDAVSPDWIFLISVAIGLASTSILVWVVALKMKKAKAN